MATMSELRAALAVRLATNTGLRTSATLPDQPNPPQAVIYPDRVLYDTALGRGSDEYTFIVLVIVGRIAERSAQTSLDAYCNPSGATSIKAAIEGDPTLGGNAFDCRVTEMRGQSSLTLGDATYLTAEFSVTALAN
ncbi:MAG TPA: hypothetical protein VIG24_14505 [Acidimicrobiia bacterium]